jgi:hypothetical protein
MKNCLQCRGEGKCGTGTAVADKLACNLQMKWLGKQWNE